jgi:glycosyltransferase involved in cell wall biosynthesis
VRSHLACFLKAPGGYLRVLLGALAEGGADPRAIARQTGAFALAVVVARDLDGSGCRHVHTHFAGTPSHVASLVAKLGNAVYGDARWTWSVTIHGPVEFFDVTEYRLRRRAREAEFVAYVSEFAHDQLLAAIDSSEWPKLHLVRCGLDVESFNGERPDRAQEGPFELLTVGRHVHVKSPAVMVEAISHLLERGLEVHLTMIGDGPLNRELRELAAGLGTGEAITFAGALGQDDIPAHLGRADAFCLSSVAESLPVVLMEAMASGLPVVTTDVGGIAELVEDGVSGLLVSPGDSVAFADAIERLIREPELGERLGRTGRELIRSEFDVQRSAAKLADRLQAV